MFDPSLDTLPRLSFELDDFTTVTQVSIRDQNGVLLNGVTGPIELGARNPGRVDLPEDLLAAYLKDAKVGAGNYTFSVNAEFGPPDPEPTSQNPDPAPAFRNTISWTPYVGGIVTGTSLTGDEPMLLVGNALIPINKVLEIREPGGFGE